MASARPAPFDLKSASLTLTALVLRSADVAAVDAEMQRRWGGDEAVFDDEALVVDVAALADDGSAPDLPALLALLRRHGFRPLALRGAPAAWGDIAAATGLLVLPETAAPAPMPAVPAAAAAAAAAPATPAVESAADSAAAATAATTATTTAVAPPPAAAAAPTLVIDRPLRSGQQVYARGGDLIVLAPVSFGAEVIADGHVHVYAPLRGRAIAGARGDAAARIFSTCMEPQLVAVAGTYRTIEAALPDGVAGKPAMVRLDGDRLVIEALAR